MNTARLFVTIGLILLTAGVCATAFAEDTSQIEIIEVGQPLKVKAEPLSVGVMAFKIMGKISGVTDDTGMILSDAMVSEIDSDRFKIYERSQLKALLEEKGLQESTLVSNPGRCASFGKLTGVRYIVLGSLGRLANQHHLSARMVDCRSGMIMARGWVTFRFLDDWPDKVAELVNILGLRSGSGPVKPKINTGGRFPTGNDLFDSLNAPADFTVKITTNDKKQMYLEDDQIRFVVESNRDCFITLITIDSEGNMTRLLPNYWQKRAFVRRGRKVMIPPSDAEFWFRIQPPHGETLVKAIATLRPLMLSGAKTKGTEKQQFTPLKKGVKAIGLEGDPDKGKADLGVNLHDLLKPAEWSTAELVVVTRKENDLVEKANKWMQQSKDKVVE